eukprot:UN11728
MFSVPELPTRRKRPLSNPSLKMQPPKKMKSSPSTSPIPEGKGEDDGLKVKGTPIRVGQCGYIIPEWSSQPNEHFLRNCKP